MEGCHCDSNAVASFTWNYTLVKVPIEVLSAAITVQLI